MANAGNGQWLRLRRSVQRRPPDYRASHRSFEGWFHTPLGQALLKDQRACVNTHVADMGGARQLHIALSHRLVLAPHTDYTQHILATPYWRSDLPEGVVVCDPDELPFPTGSVDLVILHHSADFSAWPHQVLRESARVLRGGGQLLVLGFNPISTWGVRRLLSRHRRGPWGGRFLLRSRMEDWLNLLDCSVEHSGSYFFRLPLQRDRVMERRSLLEYLGTEGMLPVGAYYCIVATKRVCAPIARRRAWRPGKVIPMPTPGTLGVSRQGHAQGGAGRNAQGRVMADD